MRETKEYFENREIIRAPLWIITLRVAAATLVAAYGSFSRSVDTIAAISTPPGRGGIGIVRLSGPFSVSIATQLVYLRQPLEHGRARLADVLDTPDANGDATRIDERWLLFLPHRARIQAKTWLRLRRMVRRWC